MAFTRQQVLDRAAFIFGSGVAATDGGATSTVVLGIGFDIETFSPSGDKNSAKFRITLLDNTSYAKLCIINIPRTDKNGWFFDYQASVGNYLDGSREFDDEIKIATFRGKFRRTDFYDPRTCARLVRIKHRLPTL